MIKPFFDRFPIFKGTVYVADEAQIIGSVYLDEGASVWYGAVIRADLNNIYIGKSTNIQEQAVLHPTVEKEVVVGDYVTVGHGAIVHACKVGTGSLIGMNATILDGAEIGDHSIVAAQTVILTGSIIPPRSLVAGVPGKIIRTLSEEEVEELKSHSLIYEELAKKSLTQVTGGE